MIEIGNIPAGIAVTFTEGAIGGKSKTFSNMKLNIRTDDEIKTIVFSEDGKQDLIDIAIDAGIFMQIADRINSIKKEKEKIETNNQDTPKGDETNE